MRQIAHMGARALDDLTIGIEQRIGLARQRRDFDREAALQLFGLCRSGCAASCCEMRLSGDEAELHLETGRQQQHQRKTAEGDDQGAVEAADLVFDFGGIAGNRDEITAPRRRDRRCARPAAAADPPAR